MPDQRKRLLRAIEAARAALATRVGIDIAREELRQAYVDVADVHDEVSELLVELGRARDIPTVHANVPACPSCSSGELLLADDCSFETFYVGNAAAALKFALVACTNCGDLRMWSRDVGALHALQNALGRACFVHVSVPVRSGPFR